MTERLFRCVDDFYPEPDLLREIALRSTYYVPEHYFGPRSTKGFLPRGTVEKICSSFGFDKISLINVQHRSTHFYTSLAKGSQRTTFFAHIDGARSARHPLFSMIVYLSLKAPQNSGTGIYRHRKTGLWQEPTAEEVLRLGRSQGDLEEQLAGESGRRSAWELLDSSENVYNRAVLFPAHWYHSSRRDFGGTMEKGRLYQAFFFYGYPNVFEDTGAGPHHSAPASALAGNSRGR